MPHQTIHTEMYTQIISRLKIIDHLSTRSGNKIDFENIVGKLLYDSMEGVSTLSSNLNMCFRTHGFSTRKHMKRTNKECMCIIHKCTLQEVCFDLDSVTKVTLAFSVSYFRIFKVRSSNNWLFGRKSLENSVNRKKVNPFNKLTDISYVCH